MKTDIETKELKACLANFRKPEAYHQIPLLGTVFTDGVKYLADHADCFWLLTDASTIAKSLMNRSDFISIDFRMLAEEEQDFLGYDAVIEYKDRYGNKLENHKYHLEDFPLDEICLFFTNNTLLLPSEY